MEVDDLGPMGLDVRRFISWLGYCYCEVVVNYPGQLSSVRNTENGLTSSVPTDRAIIGREMMYWICKELMVDMSPGFEAYQQMWDAAEPDPYDKEGDETI